jgi:hypothetical protein
VMATNKEASVASNSVSTVGQKPRHRGRVGIVEVFSSNAKRAKCHDNEPRPQPSQG